jgi:CHAD domain-containing protein
MEKWLGNVSPDEPTAEVAERALRDRLDAAMHYLPLAAERADEDPEYVHGLRVWSRRSASALRLFASLVPGGPRGWLKKQLRKLRRAAGEARDCDVLIRRLAHRPPDAGTERWLNRLRGRRTAAQGPIVKLNDRLAPRFRRRTEKLLRNRRSDDSRFGDWARERLRPAVERFFDSLPGEAASNRAWHRFRICGKKLRYTMELLAGAFPPNFRDDLYRVVEEVQERLGAVNDLVTAQERLRDDASGLKELAAEQRGRINDMRADFRAWFGPERREALRAGFEECLAAPVGQPG